MGRLDTAAWYVLRTKPRAEARAAASLCRKQIEIYFPRLALPRQCVARQGDGDPTEPLFPGYLFAYLSLAEQYHLAAWSPGVRNFLTFGDELAEPIDEEVVGCLKQRASGGDILRPLPSLRPGDQVEVKTGPFVGLLAVIDRPIPASGRVKIFLEILRRQTRVELPVAAVARL